MTRWVICVISLELCGARKTLCLCRKLKWLTFTNWGALLLIFSGMFHSRLEEVRWPEAIGGGFGSLQRL